MRIEVLLSTMNQKDLDFIRQVNIQTDAVVINQANEHSYIETEGEHNNVIKVYTFQERGIGLSRNTALQRSTADVCVIADDDVVYVDGYNEIVLDEFKKNPSADMIVFNVPIHKHDGTIRTKVKKSGRVRLYNGLKYGTVNFAFKRESIIKNNINFSLLFGAARYGSGEDTLFLVEMLKKKLKIYASTEIIGNINDDKRESSWFKGYDEKYLYDRGALFRAIGGKWSCVLNLQFLLRHRKKFNEKIGFCDAYKYMNKGSKEFK